MPWIILRSAKTWGIVQSKVMKPRGRHGGIKGSMMKWPHFLALSAILSVSMCVPRETLEAKSWLCIGDNAGAITKIKNDWKGAEVESGDKYIIKPLDIDDRKYQSIVNEKFPIMSHISRWTHGFYYFGLLDKFPELLCSEETESVICRSENSHEFIDQFVINMKSRRFEFVFTGSYLFGDGKLISYPEIEIGSCSEI